MAMQVYALYASDEPNKLRYVGLTRQSLQRRLLGHVKLPSSKSMRQWIAAVHFRKAEVCIRALSEHKTELQASDAEIRWIRNLMPVGNLLNRIKSNGLAFDGQSLNERLRAWRINRGFTQQQAATFYGAAIQTYQHWEQGHSVPKGAAMRGIERVMEDQQ